MHIRNATLQDLDALAQVEATCFPPAEAASREAIKERLLSYPNHFWLLFEGDELISFADGFVTDERILTDEMFERAKDHQEEGRWQMIFGVNTLPAYRRRGYASLLLRQVIEDARSAGRSGVILTCKEEKIPFYARLGFENTGESPSVHGGSTWYQMELLFTKEPQP